MRALMGEAASANAGTVAHIYRTSKTLWGMGSVGYGHVVGVIVESVSVSATVTISAPSSL